MQNSSLNFRIQSWFFPKKLTLALILNSELILQALHRSTYDDVSSLSQDPWYVLITNTPFRVLIGSLSRVQYSKFYFFVEYLTAANLQVYREKNYRSLNFTCLRFARLFQAIGKHCRQLQSIVLSQCGSLSSQGITSLANKCRKLKMFDVAMTKVRTYTTLWKILLHSEPSFFISI